jgi:hypothetical protein
MSELHRHKLYVEGQIIKFVHGHNHRYRHTHRVIQQDAYYMAMPPDKKKTKLQVAK